LTPLFPALKILGFPEILMKTRLLTYSKLRRLFLTDALRRSKVGDEVEVKVLRDGQPLTVSVRLEQHR
jgi:hypothetical protein